MESIVTDYQSLCLVCNKPSVEMHHLISGVANRPLSDEDGLIVPLCRKCHTQIHEDPVTNKISRIIGQLAWEKNNIHLENPRKEFMKRYGKSYL